MNNSNIIWIYLSSIAITYIWYINTTIELKIRTIIYAALFSIIEFIWYIVTEDKDGDIIIAPSFKLSNGHTTLSMFLVNVFYTPILIDYYFSNIKSHLMRALLFPLNVWLEEILFGYYLLLIWRTRAWEYTSGGAFFHGNIKISFWKYWMILGLILSFMYEYLFN